MRDEGETETTESTNERLGSERVKHKRGPEKAEEVLQERIIDSVSGSHQPDPSRERVSDCSSHTPWGTD